MNNIIVDNNDITTSCTGMILGTAAYKQPLKENEVWTIKEYISKFSNINIENNTFNGQIEYPALKIQNFDTMTQNVFSNVLIKNNIFGNKLPVGTAITAQSTGSNLAAQDISF